MKREQIDFIIANSSGFIEACHRIADESYSLGVYHGSIRKDLIDTEAKTFEVYNLMKKDING
jgi:hypothetical protein